MTTQSPETSLCHWNLRITNSPNNVSLWVQYVHYQAQLFPNNRDLIVRQLKIAERARDINPQSEILAQLCLNLSRFILPPSTVLEQFREALVQFPNSFSLVVSYLNATITYLPVDTALLVAGDMTQQWIQGRNRVVSDLIGIFVWTLIVFKQAGFVERALGLVYCQIKALQLSYCDSWEQQLDQLASHFLECEKLEIGMFLPTTLPNPPMSACSINPLNPRSVVMFGDLAPHLIPIHGLPEAHASFIAFLMHSGVRFHLTYFHDHFSSIENVPHRSTRLIVPHSTLNLSPIELSWFNFCRPSIDLNERANVQRILQLFMEIPGLVELCCNLFACTTLACDLPDQVQLIQGGLYTNIFSALEQGKRKNLGCSYEWQVAMAIVQFEKLMVEGMDCERLATQLESELNIKAMSRISLIQQPSAVWTYFDISYSIAPVVLYSLLHVYRFRKVTLDDIAHNLGFQSDYINSVYKSVIVIEISRIQALRCQCLPPVPQSFLKDACMIAVRQCPLFIKTWLLLASVVNWVTGQYEKEAERAFDTGALAPLMLFTNCNLQVSESVKTVISKVIAQRALLKFPFSPMVWNFILSMAESATLSDPSVVNQHTFKSIILQAVSACPWHIDISIRCMYAAQCHNMIMFQEISALRGSIKSHHLNIWKEV